MLPIASYGLSLIQTLPNMGAGVSMIFSEPYSLLILAFAVLGLIIDLWVDEEQRKHLIDGHRAWWDRLRSATHSQLLSDAASGFYGIPTIKIAAGRSRFFYIAIANVAVGVAGTGSLIVGALIFTPNPEAVFSHVYNFFAAPSAAIVLAWLAATYGLLSRIVREPSSSLQFLFIFLLAVGAFLMWVSLMHMGTWLEWQHKRTATGYGTEWFYAEVFIEYVREPIGRLVSLTAALIVGIPVAPCLLRVFFSTGCKCLRPVLKPLLSYLIVGIAVTRRGVLGILALLLALLTGVFGT
jgi:hypothetical protein